MAVDTQGNVLAAGYTTNTGTGQDFTVAKFAPDGTLLWQQTLNGTANVADAAFSVAVDTQGNVLAAGFTSNTGTGRRLHGREVRPRRDPALAADPQRHRQWS